VGWRAHAATGRGNGATEDTFTIIEMAVRKPYRRQGIARQLHAALLADVRADRVTLLARPEAEPAQAAYRDWGYRTIGKVRPWPDAPAYDAMWRPLLPMTGG
jgi:ribosomal protein S18 acetylase RimI-like enzyme